MDARQHKVRIYKEYHPPPPPPNHKTIPLPHKQSALNTEKIRRSAGYSTGKLRALCLKLTKCQKEEQITYEQPLVKGTTDYVRTTTC